MLLGLIFQGLAPEIKPTNPYFLYENIMIAQHRLQLFRLLDTGYPMRGFRKDSASVVKLARRLKKMNTTLFGRYNVGKVLHLSRRLNAEFLALAG